MMTNNESIGLNKRRIQNETIREVAYSCSEYSMFEKYLMRRNKNLPISETRVGEKRISVGTRIYFYSYLFRPDYRHALYMIKTKLENGNGKRGVGEK